MLEMYEQQPKMSNSAGPGVEKAKKNDGFLRGLEKKRTHNLDLDLDLY